MQRARRVSAGRQPADTAKSRGKENLITNERLVEYIHSLEPERSELLEAVRREALAADVPIIRDETAALLKCFIKAFQPHRILEIGTAVGYSALTMAEVMPEDATILTVENYPPRIMKARQNLGSSPCRDRITLREEDAGTVIRELAEEKQCFDFIFMDAAKAQYPVWLPGILTVLRSGGILLSDNILQDGTITESRYQVERRDRTIHTRMREYLFTLKHHPQLDTSIIPIGDGVSFSVKKQ